MQSSKVIVLFVVTNDKSVTTRVFTHWVPQELCLQFYFQLFFYWQFPEWYYMERNANRKYGSFITAFTSVALHDVISTTHTILCWWGTWGHIYIVLFFLLYFCWKFLLEFIQWFSTFGNLHNVDHLPKNNSHVTEKSSFFITRNVFFQQCLFHYDINHRQKF